MSDSQSISTAQVYKRLWRFVVRYKWRFTLAVLAGLMSATSAFGLLGYSRNIVRPFEEKLTVEQQEALTQGVPYSEIPEVDDSMRDLIEYAGEHGIDVVHPDGKMTWQFMLLGISFLPVLLIVRALGIYLNKYMMRWIAGRVTRDIRDQVFENLQNQSLAFYGKSDVGQMMSRCTNDINVAEYTMASTIGDLLRAPFEVLAAVIFIVVFAVKWKLIAVVSLMFLVFPLCLLPIIFLGRKVKRHTRSALDKVGDLVSRMHENFTGIRIVKAFHTEAKELARFQKMSFSYFKSVVRALRAELAMTPVMEATGVVLFCGFLVYCFARGIALSQIIPFGLAAVIAYKPLKNLAQVSANLQRGAAALHGVYGLLDADQHMESPKDGRIIKDTGSGIRFENVSFSYGNHESMVLKGIEVDIPKGSVVAVVGETGSGKTTMANLLARFYDPTEGRVTIDGTDLKEVDVLSLRKLIGIVTQETILFNDTIANNIAYGSDDVDMAAVERAAREANAHDFIVGEQDGYQRVVGEKGFVLSGGEKQRVSIARAILRNPPVLILDEATSALDTVTERLVQEAIAHLMKDRTVFAIAHRLSTIRHADQILLIDKGEIVERGTHNELYEKGGKYRELCDMQMTE